MTDFRLVKNGKLDETKVKRSNSSFSEQLKSRLDKMDESFKPKGWDDQGHRDEN